MLLVLSVCHDLCNAGIVILVALVHAVDEDLHIARLHGTVQEHIGRAALMAFLFHGKESDRTYEIPAF